MGDVEQSSPRRPPWRLSDLSTRARLVALALAVLLAVPYVAAVARAVDVGWNPSNDDALIALRVHDVLDGEWPRLGQPSTAENYTASETLRHPGPIQFYLLAPLVALVGADLGLPLGAAAINLSAVLVAAWVIFRRAGPAVGLAAAPLVAAMAWAQGPVQLVDPVSSNMGGIPLLALAALAWAVVDGDIRMLPLGAFVLAFVAQQHLAVFGMAGGLAAWMIFGVVVTLVGLRRASGAEVASGDDVSGRTSPVRPGPWVAAAIAVSFVAWGPVLVDQVAGSGNLGRMLSFAGSSDRPDLGLRAGIRQAARALGVPPLVLRTDLTGHDIIAPLPWFGWFGALAASTALVAVAVTDRARRRGRAALAATVLLLAVLGSVTGSNVPDSVEAGRLNLYRWTFVVSTLTWVTIGWAGASALQRRMRDRKDPGLSTAGPSHRIVSGRIGPRPVAVAMVAVAAMTVAAVAGSGPRTWRDQEVFAAEEHLSSALLAEVADLDRLLVVPVGRSAEFAVVPALVLDLVQAGHDFVVPPSQATGYGAQRVAAGDFDAAVVVVSGPGEAQQWPGRLIARVDLNQESYEARVTLAEQVRTEPLVVSPDADAVLEAVLGTSSAPVATMMVTYLEGFADDPENVLRHSLVGGLLEAGYFVSPSFDAAALATLAANPPVENWGDDIIEVRLLGPDEIDDHLDALMAVGIGRPVG